MKRAFLINPVRGGEMEGVRGVIGLIESCGASVYVPQDHTDQSAESLEICRQNLDAIRKSDFVVLFWDGVSQGCLFDLGMSFALGKKIVICDVPEKTESKSFQNMVMEWERSQSTM